MAPPIHIPALGSVVPWIQLLTLISNIVPGAHVWSIQRPLAHTLKVSALAPAWYDPSVQTSGWAGHKSATTWPPSTDKQTEVWRFNHVVVSMQTRIIWKLSDVYVAHITSLENTITCFFKSVLFSTDYTIFCDTYTQVLINVLSSLSWTILEVVCSTGIPLCSVLIMISTHIVI